MAWYTALITARPPARISHLPLTSPHPCHSLPLPAAFAAAKARYETTLAGMGGKELLVSCSDDFTLFLWDPADEKKPIARMTGHQAPVNHIAFSPDGRFVASAG